MSDEIKQLSRKTEKLRRNCKMNIWDKEYTPFGMFNRGNFLNQGSPEEELIDSNDGKMKNFAEEINNSLDKLVGNSESIEQIYSKYFKDIENNRHLSKYYKDYDGISKEHHEWVKDAFVVGGAIAVGAAYLTGVGEVATAGAVAGELLIEEAETTEAVEGIETLGKEIINGPYVKDGKPYGRPSYKKGQIEEVWENAKGLDGKVRDPNTGEILEWDKSINRNGQWDMGHIKNEKYFDKWKEYQQGKISKKDFLDWYKDPKNYRPESPSANRSHLYE